MLPPICRDAAIAAIILMPPDADARCLPRRHDADADYAAMSPRHAA